MPSLKPFYLLPQLEHIKQTVFWKLRILCCCCCVAVSVCLFFFFSDLVPPCLRPEIGT